MREIHKNYSSFTQIIEIGKSIQNKSLLVLKLGYEANGDKQSKESFWFDSAIHAREWATITASLYTIDKVIFLSILFSF
jgi:hypothetical protein